jgi:hypothetical protein
LRCCLVGDIASDWFGPAAAVDRKPAGLVGRWHRTEPVRPHRTSRTTVFPHPHDIAPDLILTESGVQTYCEGQ